jgi:nucleoside-diphosphate-sugar epimerase
LYQEFLTGNYTKQKNLKLTIARLGHIYGPGEEAYQKLIPTVFNKIIKKEVIEIFGNENDLRSFLYVEDACTVIANLAKDEFAPELINVVSSQAITIKKIVEQIISITESNTTIQHNESKKIPPRSLTFDNTLMQKYLSTETTFEEGIKKEWQYLKKKYA